MKADSIKVAYLQYIHEEWQDNPHLIDMDKLQSVVWVKTNRGFMNPADTPVHFSTLYLNPYDLNTEFQGT